MADESASHLNKPNNNDSVTSLSHDEAHKQEVSTAAGSTPDVQGVKFSHRIIKYPNDELKIFEANSVIGSGSFGRVRKYHHKDKIVAVKEFSITGDDETINDIWSMVQREANVLCHFQHENIVKIKGITQWPNVIGMIMEYIEGGNLQKLLSENNQSDKQLLSWKTRMNIANGITSGLDYIHNYDETKTFCHGDVKPANVLLTQSLQVKLADFGSAAFHRATAAATTTIKQVSTTQFTLIYVAPEFLEDNTRKRIPAMDMYSFAMVLYELISRKAPYSDSSMPMHVPGLIIAKVKPSMKLIDNVESQLETDDDRASFSLLKKLMQKCWNHDPDSRPSSKTVKMELGNFSMNLSQGFSPRIYGSHNADPEAATDRENTSASKTTKQNFQSSTSGASGRRFWSGVGQSSTSSGTNRPNQTSSAKTTLKDLLETLSDSLPKGASSLIETMESVLHASGASVLIGNQESVQDLLAKYTDSLLNFKFEEADMFRAALRSLIVDDVNAQAQNVFLFAKKLNSEEKFLQSVPISDTAAAMFAKMKNPENDFEQIQFCVQEMRRVNEKLIEEDSKMKVIVREHVIPLMRNWLHVMKGKSQVSEKWRCINVCRVLYHTAICEKEVDQWEQSGQTLEEAISEMRRVFRGEVLKQHGHLFGALLHNLSVNYQHESRFEEATALLEESIKAHKFGLDYFGDEEARKREIEMSESGLKILSREIWEQQLKT